MFDKIGTWIFASRKNFEKATFVAATFAMVVHMMSAAGCITAIQGVLSVESLVLMVPFTMVFGIILVFNVFEICIWIFKMDDVVEELTELMIEEGLIDEPIEEVV